MVRTSFMGFQHFGQTGICASMTQQLGFGQPPCN